MQVLKEDFWPERSLSYACRSFDSLNHGEGYGQVLPVIHIGFVNFTLFPEHPELYSTYQLLNVKSHHIYSDKFRISVVDLNQADNATEDDIRHGVDLWARVLKATTWEEVETLAQNNEYLQEAVSGVRQLTEDERIRQQCQAREDFHYWERIKNAHHKRELQQREDIIAQREDTIREQADEIAKLRAELAVYKK